MKTQPGQEGQGWLGRLNHLVDRSKSAPEAVPAPKAKEKADWLGRVSGRIARGSNGTQEKIEIVLSLPDDEVELGELVDNRKWQREAVVMSAIRGEYGAKILKLPGKNGKQQLAFLGRNAATWNDQDDWEAIARVEDKDGEERLLLWRPTGMNSDEVETEIVPRDWLQSIQFQPSEKKAA